MGATAIVLVPARAIGEAPKTLNQEGAEVGVRGAQQVNQAASGHKRESIPAFKAFYRALPQAENSKTFLTGSAKEQRGCSFPFERKP